LSTWLLVPDSLLVGPWERRHWLALGALDLTGVVGALERVGDLVKECVARAVHGAAPIERALEH